MVSPSSYCTFSGLVVLPESVRLLVPPPLVMTLHVAPVSSWNLTGRSPTRFVVCTALGVHCWLYLPYLYQESASPTSSRPHACSVSVRALFSHVNLLLGFPRTSPSAHAGIMILLTFGTRLSICRAFRRTLLMLPTTVLARRLGCGLTLSRRLLAGVGFLGMCGIFAFHSTDYLFLLSHDLQLLICCFESSARINTFVESQTSLLQQLFPKGILTNPVNNLISHALFQSVSKPAGPS